MDFYVVIAVHKYAMTTARPLKLILSVACFFVTRRQKMSTDFLKVIPPNTPCDLPTDMAITYTYPLDPFQQHAIVAISRGENVLVTAKTGSGKTLVGEYQIAHSLRAGRRVFYTTPIKSHSNQKFHDLTKAFPQARRVS